MKQLNLMPILTVTTIIILLTRSHLASERCCILNDGSEILDVSENRNNLMKSKVCESLISESLSSLPLSSDPEAPSSILAVLSEGTLPLGSCGEV